VGAIVNNMKDYLKPTSKKLYIYSAVSKKFLLFYLCLVFYDCSQFTLTSCSKWPNVWVSISLITLMLSPYIDK